LQSQSQSQSQSQLQTARTGPLAALAGPAEAGVYDELRDAAGALRPEWRRFSALLPPPEAGQSPAADLDQRLLQVARQIQRDGVTHNVYSDEGVAARPWSLELLPLIVGAAEWKQIEAGLEQRAAVLEAMLHDLYGPQHLLHEGLLPPALLLRHPGYLRPMRGVQPVGGQWLHIVAFDLARGPDGRWWVVSQRAQGPSGLGYVLHNRLVVSRQFPDALRELRVQRLGPSYRRLMQGVEDMAATLAGGAAPRIVLLTPGPYSETYFEHAYLARYLGLSLAEGGDLTVRGDRLYLRTVEGLDPVHGLLRRLDDDWCDPLELRPDSTLGVPGLMKVARAGNVVMANALGSAFLESPAVQGFLPGIAERLTGQRLRLPALPTWWCGEAAAWRDVRDQLDGKLLRSTFQRGAGVLDVRGAGKQIEADPDAWTLQARVPLSRAPVWAAGQLQPRPAVLRVYAVADGNGGWHLMPGGMTRVAPREHSGVSMQRGGSSLDTWVLTEGPLDHFEMAPQRLSVDDLMHRKQPVSSRTGENLFWLGRYTERTEQLVRLARVTLQTIDGDVDTSTEPALQALSTLGVRSSLAPTGVPTLVQSAHHFERAVLAGLTDPQAWSVAFNLGALERASQALRERLSSEQWGQIRAMRESFAAALQAAPGKVPDLALAMPALDALALQLVGVTGLQTDRMTRDHGWRLLTVGRLIERLIGVCASMEAFLQSRALGGVVGIDLLLELFDSTITFRARYQRHEEMLALAELLVFEDGNPRAFAGVLRRLRTELQKLPGSAGSLQPLLDRLPAAGVGLTLEDLRMASDEQIARRLLQVSQSLRAAALALAEDVSGRFFTLVHGTDQTV
jgi:uncharacterized circularly permuted ATP-grasp superfamily protein/uncharacterized alpha-E superfamily protein